MVVPTKQINEGYDALAKAIIYQAMIDYFDFNKEIKKREKSKKLYDMTVVKRRKAKMKEIEDFMLSDEVKHLTDLDSKTLIKGLKRLKELESPFLYNSEVIWGKDS